MTPGRRQVIKSLVGAAAALSIPGRRLFAAQDPLRRAIPSSGETVPAVGLGSARTFDVGSSERQRAPLRDVMRLFHELGGRVFDTAPTYGSSERVAGELAQELGIADALFLATKISTTRGRQAGERQVEGSLRAWDRDTIDLNQVHNLGQTDVHLRTLREDKAEGRTRHIGVTISRLPQFGDLEAVMRAEELDFVQVNFSLAERQAADRILPLAQDRGFGVLINEPYNGGRVFGAVRGQELPEWATEFSESWGQFFLKYILSHPAVTAVIPATGDPEHLVDNMGAGLGRLPDDAERGRMERFFDAL